MGGKLPQHGHQVSSQKNGHQTLPRQDGHHNTSKPAMAGSTGNKGETCTPNQPPAPVEEQSQAKGREDWTQQPESGEEEETLQITVPGVTTESRLSSLLSSPKIKYLLCKKSQDKMGKGMEPQVPTGSQVLTPNTREEKTELSMSERGLTTS